MNGNGMSGGRNSFQNPSSKGDSSKRKKNKKPPPHESKIQNVKVMNKMPKKQKRESKRIKKNKQQQQQQNQNQKLPLIVSAVNYPVVRLTLPFFQSLQEALDHRIDEIPYGQPLPEIDVFKLLSEGVIKIDCRNVFSEKWVKAVISELCVLDGIQMEVQKRAPPKFEKIYAWLPGRSIDAQTILTRLQRFNPELQTKFWEVLDVASIPNKGTQLTLMVDEASAKLVTGHAKHKQRLAGTAKVTFSSTKPTNGHSSKNEQSNNEPLAQVIDVSKPSPPIPVVNQPKKKIIKLEPIIVKQERHSFDSGSASTSHF